MVTIVNRGVFHHVRQLNDNSLYPELLSLY